MYKHVDEYLNIVKLANWVIGYRGPVNSKDELDRKILELTSDSAHATVLESVEYGVIDLTSNSTSMTIDEILNLIAETANFS